MSEALTIRDNRTGKVYDIPITDGTIRATDLRQFRTSHTDAGLMTYDPAFMNTASTRSAITFIDGNRGILWYRGYPIEQLAEHATFLEVAYLLIYGELPTATALTQWAWQITHHTWVHENVKQFMNGFHHDAHTMSMLISAVAAISTFYPDAKVSDDAGHRDLQTYR
jgi:citrate synthase